VADASFPDTLVPPRERCPVNIAAGDMRGAAHPAWYTLWRRLSELEIHHVDLNATPAGPLPPVPPW
jgi:hypothetical protein